MLVASFFACQGAGESARRNGCSPRASDGGVRGRVRAPSSPPATHRRTWRLKAQDQYGAGAQTCCRFRAPDSSRHAGHYERMPRYRPDRPQRPPGTTWRSQSPPPPLTPLAESNPSLAQALVGRFVRGLVAAWPEGQLVDAEVREGLRLGFGDVDGHPSLCVEFAGMGERVEWDGSTGEAEEIVDGAVERFADELEGDRWVFGGAWREWRS